MNILTHARVNFLSGAQSKTSEPPLCLLDVPDLGGHLDLTHLYRATPLKARVVSMKLHVAAVGALPFGSFSRMAFR